MRLLRAFVGALLLHGLAYWLLATTAPPRALEGPRQRVVEFSLRPLRQAPPAPAPDVIPPPTARPADAPKQVPRPKIPPPPPGSTPPPPGSTPPPPGSPPPSGRIPDLFPRDVLLRHAGEAAPQKDGGPRKDGRTLNESNRAAVAAAEAAQAERETRERVARWTAEENARVATEQNRIDPVWRRIEGRLAQDFKPPVASLHDVSGGAARRLGSVAGQIAAMVRRGEEGLRRPRFPGQVVETAPGRPVDPSQQNHLGDPEGIGVRAMPMEQQQAALNAWSDPATWHSVEVEIETDASGQVTGARVIVPSERRAFNRFALEEVRRHVAALGAGLGASISRWRCEAAYAVSASPSIGLTFDESMLFSKKARKDFAAKYPLKEDVRTRVTLRWVRPPL